MQKSRSSMTHNRAYETVVGENRAVSGGTAAGTSLRDGLEARRHLLANRIVAARVRLGLGGPGAESTRNLDEVVNGRGGDVEAALDYAPPQARRRDVEEELAVVADVGTRSGRRRRQLVFRL